MRPRGWLREQQAGRHDYATRFLAAGGDVRALMQVMGWESPRMVQRYVTFRAEHLADIQARVS